MHEIHYFFIYFIFCNNFLIFLFIFSTFPTLDVIQGAVSLVYTILFLNTFLSGFTSNHVCLSFQVSCTLNEFYQQQKNKNSKGTSVYFFGGYFFRQQIFFFRSRYFFSTASILFVSKYFFSQQIVFFLAANCKMAEIISKSTR